jgi:hypothetical protein
VIQNIDMAKNTKGKQGRMTLPKKGVTTLSKKKSSEFIIPADDSALVHNTKDKRVTTCVELFDDDSSDVSDPPTSKVASVPAGSSTDTRLKKLPTRVNLSKKRISEFITPTDESTLLDNRKYKKVTKRDDIFDDDSSDVSDPPTSKLASVPVEKRTEPRVKKLSTAVAKPPPVEVFESSEPNLFILEHGVVTKKPKIQLSVALQLMKQESMLELQNKVSLQNNTIKTLQNTIRENLANQEQAKNFSDWEHEITKIVGEIFHKSKFAHKHISKHVILIT